MAEPKQPITLPEGSSFSGAVGAGIAGGIGGTLLGSVTGAVLSAVITAGVALVTGGIGNIDILTDLMITVGVPTTGLLTTLGAGAGVMGGVARYQDEKRVKVEEVAKVAFAQGVAVGQALDAQKERAQEAQQETAKPKWAERIRTEQQVAQTQSPVKYH